MLGSLRRKNVTLSSIGQSATWAQAPHWQREMLNGGNGLWMAGVPQGRSETIEANFAELVQKAYKVNGPVFACILARAMPFSEARFLFQEVIDGRPGRLRGGAGLDLLDNPWPNATTGELLWRMEQDASIAGNSYLTPVGKARKRIRRLRPDWVTIVSGVAEDDTLSQFHLEAEVLGYIYQPRGVPNPPAPVFLTPDRVVHYSPIPDPEAQWRGMSWLQPIVDEILADNEATKHKLKFFENGTTSNMIVTYDASVDAAAVARFKALFDESHVGTRNAYKAIHLGGGADAKTLGADMKQLDFKATQGAGETRIAAASGVGAIMARFSEGLQGSSLNAGNYGAAKRQFADMTLRPLWRTASAALSKLAPPPADHRLWYDTRDIEFLKEDRKDQTEILQQSAATINTLVTAGYLPDAVIDAVEAGDLSRLTGKHSGRYSVQLQAPGTTAAGDPVQQTLPI